MIYFAQAGRAGPIKIGSTRDLAKRMAAFAVDNHEVVALLCSVEGDQPLEKRIHRLLRPHRVKGEWFRPSSEIVELVAIARSGDLLEHVATMEARQNKRLAELDQVTVCVRREASSVVRKMLETEDCLAMHARCGIPMRTIQRFATTGDGPFTAFMAIVGSRDALDQLLRKIVRAA